MDGGGCSQRSLCAGKSGVLRYRIEAATRLSIKRMEAVA